jgi:hypothetical protein
MSRHPRAGTVVWPLAVGISAKRARLGSGFRSVYEVVLRSFAATGRAPAAATLEAAAAQFGLPAGQALAELADTVTGAQVTVAFRDGKATWSPDTAVVFVDRHEGDGPAELVICGCLNFVASADTDRACGPVHLAARGRYLPDAG